MPRSKTRRRRPARTAARARPASGTATRRSRRFLPERRSRRIAVYLVAGLIYVSVMWIWVFPWVDRTFVNQPAVDLDPGFGAVPTATATPTSTPTATPTVLPS